MFRVSRPVSAFLCLILVMATVIPFFPVSTAQDISKPQITDLTTGEPEVGTEFTIITLVTDDGGVSYARLYYYFVVSGGITPPEYILMTFIGANKYQATVQVSDEASVLSYVVYAYDTSNNPANTDVISRDVVDNTAPIASCPSLVSLNMSETATFNGTGSTDNTGITNYTWTISYNGATITLYGPAPTYPFQLAGSYSGRLTVKDSYGNSHFAGFIINVLDTEPPSADAGIQTYLMSGEYLFLDGGSSTDNLGVTNYTWSYIYNGSMAFLYGDSPSIIMWTAGVYNVTLTVTDAAGNADSAVIQVQVLNTEVEVSATPWWTYVLIGMVIAIIIAAIIIIKY